MAIVLYRANDISRALAKLTSRRCREGAVRFRCRRRFFGFEPLVGNADSLPVQRVPPSSKVPIRMRLPLVTLYLTERCNSRCVTCDYWRHGRVDLGLESASSGCMPSLTSLRTRDRYSFRAVSRCCNPHWPGDCTSLLKGAGLGPVAADLGPVARETRRAARRRCSTRSPIAWMVPIAGPIRRSGASMRSTKSAKGFGQRWYRIEGGTACDPAARQLPGVAEFVELAHRFGVDNISFLAVDVANPHAFGRTDDFASDLALGTEDLPVFGELIAQIGAAPSG